MKGDSPLFANYSIRRAGSGSSSAGSPDAKTLAAMGLGADLKKRRKPRKAAKARKRGGKKTNKRPIFTKKGHVTLRSISARREFFLGKSIARIEHELRTHGYEVKRRSSTISGSKAKIVLTLNPSKHRNISQIQISPGSDRHGNVPYVKISTTDYGRIKIIGGDRKSYKTDGAEKATILYRRKRK